MGLILIVGVINYFGPKHSGSVSIWLAIPAVLVGRAHHRPKRAPSHHRCISNRGTRTSGNLGRLRRRDPRAQRRRSGRQHHRRDEDRSGFDPGTTEGHAHRDEGHRAGRDSKSSSGPRSSAGPCSRCRRASRRNSRRTKRTCCASWRSTMARSPSARPPARSSASSSARLRAAPFQRGQHRDRRADRRHLHDGAGWRDAAPVGAPESTTACRRFPLFVAVGIPIVILAVTKEFEGLAGLYAIGVVGAITVNLGSCTFNKRLGLEMV